MSISNTLDSCLRSKGCLYEVIRHPHTHTSTETAQSAHVPGDRLAKTLLLEDKYGYVAAVLPSTYHLHLSELQKQSAATSSPSPTNRNCAKSSRIAIWARCRR